jgi:acetyl esterase/lipase
MVWIHGGAFRGGSGSSPMYDGAALAKRDVVLVSVNYRLTTPGAEPPVTFPDHNEDVAAALAWVHGEIAEHGGDPSRVLLVGHSAGAGIAAAVVADPRYLERHDLDPSWLSCVVLLDTAGYDVTIAGENEADAEDGIYRAAFGDDPAVWTEASPTTHVGEGPLPPRALVVTRGSRARIAGATAFSNQLVAAGVQSRAVDVAPLSHAEVNRRIGAGDEVMTPLMTDELTACAASS